MGIIAKKLCAEFQFILPCLCIAATVAELSSRRFFLVIIIIIVEHKKGQCKYI